MEESSRKNILRILEQSLEAIRKDDVKTLKDLSNQTIHSASIFQDADSIGIAVLMFSLAKILGRSDYRELKSWKECFNLMLNKIKKAELALKQHKFSVFRDELKSILVEIGHLDPKLRKNIQDVFAIAKISKGSRLYEHGISIGRTAKLLGVSKWDLMQYAGSTGIHEITGGVNVRERIKYAKSLFK
jgi:hypothetical protein